MATLKLPIILERLTPGARDWVIVKAAQERKDPEKLARELIEEAASKDGFGLPPKTKAA